MWLPVKILMARIADRIRLQMITDSDLSLMIYVADLWILLTLGMRTITYFMKHHTRRRPKVPTYT
jgi:hypothetical protein